MSSTETIKTQNLQIRKVIARLALDHADRAEDIPRGWRNNLRWHVGHLVLTPHRLTFGLLGEPLVIPEEYATWFGNGTSPEDWKGPGKVPPLDQLAAELTSTMGPIHELCTHRGDAVYTKPITTRAGITLTTPAEALSMSHLHDGMHLGMMMAMVKALHVYNE